MTSQTNWEWPLDIGAYDQRMALTKTEYSQVQHFVDAWDTGKRPRISQLRPALPRLVMPILDALRYLDVHEGVPIATLQLYLRIMHQRKEAYWGWDEAIIADIVNRDWSAHLPGRESYAKRHFLTSAYLLYRPLDFDQIACFDLTSFARQVFGAQHFEALLEQVLLALQAIGQTGTYSATTMNVVLAKALLTNQQPNLEQIPAELLNRLYYQTDVVVQRAAFYRLSKVLFHLGIHQRLIEPDRRSNDEIETLRDVPNEWHQWCQRWQNTSTLSPVSRRRIYFVLLKAGRWVMATCPEKAHPEQWTRETVAQYIAAVNHMRVGDWSARRCFRTDGQALSPRSRIAYIEGVRTFFVDCQTWGWLPVRFDPTRAFRIPNWISSQAQPNPRTIRDDIWGKLLMAGLNLTESDLPIIKSMRGRDEMLVYPLELVRALCIVWLFCGLRRDEILRLRVNCIRWEIEDVCLLEVPVNKTGQSFHKPVDQVVGETIARWCQVRPASASMLDQKTNERVQFLFVYRGQQIGKDYINDKLIPILCRKANLPLEDARGRITSHRARSTIASQLANAPEPMSLGELQQWLGHQNPDTTRHYIRVTPVRQAKAYHDAEYLKHNLRLIDVLIDVEAVRKSDPDNPWRFYHLGHGYCTYDFFDQCQHRMACAHCGFYVAKSSMKAQWLEANQYLKRMSQTLMLTDAERAAVDDGIEAAERLFIMLSEVPTPDQQTTRVISVNEITGGNGDDDSP